MSTRWRILALLLMATVINYIDRINLSYAAPDFMRTYHVAPGEMGLVLSAFLWTYFLAQIPFGMAVDRWGVRVIFCVGALIWGGATMMTATVGGVGAMIFWRILLGIGEAPMVACSTNVFGKWVGDGERGLAAAVGGVAGVPLGVFLASPFIGWLLQEFGWRTVFVVTGALAVIWAAVWVSYYRDPDQHRGLAPTERQYLADNISRQVQPGGGRAISWGELLRNRNVIGLSLGQAALLFNLYFLLTWLPTFLVDQHHLTMLHTGLYSSIPWFFGLVGVVGGGFVSDGLVRRGWPVLRARKAVMASGLVLGLASFPSLFTESLAATLACLSVAIFGVLLTNSVVWAANAEVAPPSHRGRVAAIQNCVGNAGGLLAPVTVGYLLQITGSWLAPLLAAAVVACLGVACYALVISERALVFDPAEERVPVASA
jgi:ACS family D-galactonate transporter-like MFS transporter